MTFSKDLTTEKLSIQRNDLILVYYYYCKSLFKIKIYSVGINELWAHYKP